MVKVRRLIAYYETTEAKMVAHKIDENVQARWDGSWSRAELRKPLRRDVSPPISRRAGRIAPSRW